MAGTREPPSKVSVPLSVVTTMMVLSAARILSSCFIIDPMTSSNCAIPACSPTVQDVPGARIERSTYKNNGESLTG